MRGLFIVPSDYDSLVRKGVANAIAERDEGGYLECVVSVHPFALLEREIQISDTGRIVEFAQPRPSFARPLAWLKFAAHIVRVTIHLAAIARRERMDFVRAQDPYFCGLIGYLVARGTRRPFCISVHADYDKMHELDKRGGAPRIFGSRALARRLESWLLAHADRVLVITDYIARYAESRGAARDRIRLFRHVIDTATFEQVGSSGRATAGGTEDRPVISVVSRLSAQKYIDDVVDIALALRKRGVDFEIRVAGDGDERDRLERAIDRAALRDSVVLLGFQDQAALGRLHEVSVLHLSLICGASLIEACTAGICVIGYDVEWQSELIRTGETGVLVPAHDCEAAANAIEQLLRAPEERRRLGAAARAAARSMFDPQTLRGVRRGVYRDLVEGRAA